jgi:ring-1,2-phenylacetyl-CoA epoxidase subunit PaaC
MEEDDLAYLREERQFLNLLLNELPKGDWAVTILRQFLFSVFQMEQYKALSGSTDAKLAAIAEKSLKEVSYHVRWSGEWVIRLGDGTEESKQRINAALKQIWMFTGEMFQPANYELQSAKEGVGVDPSTLEQAWQEKITEVFSEALLDSPSKGWAQSGGKKGIHTEHLGFLLAEMQYLQRVYPNSTW